MSFFCIKDYYWVKTGQIGLLYDYHDHYHNKRTVKLWFRVNGHLKDIDVQKDDFMQYFVFLGF